MAADRTIARPGVLDSPADYVIAALVATAAAVTAGTWVTGQLAGLIFRHTWPPVSIGQSLAIAGRLAGHLADPRMAWPPAARPSLPGPAGFAAAAVLAAAALTAAVIIVTRQLTSGAWSCRGGTLRGPQVAATLVRAGRPGPRRLVLRAQPGRAAVHRGPTSGVRSGAAAGTGVPLAISAESSVLLFAAPRIGKTSQVVIPWLRDWPGPALVTSVRPDVVENTAPLRAAGGPVWVMAPTGMLAWPDMLAWSPASRCASFDQARIRADVMVTVGRQGKDGGDSANAAYFGMMATNLLAGWLHAAAISGRGMDAVLAWALDERLDEPVKVLRDHPAAAAGTAAMLDAAYRSPDVTRSNLWTTVQTAIVPLLAPAARATFAPPPGQGIDLEDFLRRNGTIYLLVAEKQATALAPLIAAFVDELIETAKRLADAMPGGRLDPGLGLFLDEVANTVPLQHLPALMSYAGGSGMFVTAILQNRAQAEARWGREGAAMLWGAANVKIALGGLSGEELRDLSALAGEYREALTSYQRGGTAATLQTTLTDRKTITPEEIRTLSEARREALIIHATTPAVRARLPRHYEGPDKDAYAAARDKARAIIEAAAKRRSTGDRHSGQQPAYHDEGGCAPAPARPVAPHPASAARPGLAAPPRPSRCHFSARPAGLGHPRRHRPAGRVGRSGRVGVLASRPVRAVGRGTPAALLGRAPRPGRGTPGPQGMAGGDLDRPTAIRAGRPVLARRDAAGHQCRPHLLRRRPSPRRPTTPPAPLRRNCGNGGPRPARPAARPRRPAPARTGCPAPRWTGTFPPGGPPPCPRPSPATCATTTPAAARSPAWLAARHRPRHHRPARSRHAVAMALADQAVRQAAATRQAAVAAFQRGS